MFSLPARQASQRVEVWRKLRQLGALPLRSSGYLLPNTDVQINFYNGRAIGVEIPPSVILTVVDTEPGIKNATATNTFKPAKMETGITVQVPPFINKGERIKVDTAEGTYMERA